MEREDILTLVSYQRWAMERLFRPTLKLTPDQLRAPTWLSQGSLIDSLVHIVDTQWYWRRGIQRGMLPVERLSSGDFADSRTLRDHWRQEQAELESYVESLSQSELEAQAEYRWPQARPRFRIRWHLLFHLVNHGTHHRSEIGSYLATIDRSPGDLDFIVYVAKHA